MYLGVNVLKWVFIIGSASTSSNPRLDEQERLGFFCEVEREV